MNANQNQTNPALAGWPSQNGAFQGEPEKISAQPENEPLKPENLPEKRLKIPEMSDAYAVYEPGDPTPLGWKPRSPLDRLPNENQIFILNLLNIHTYAHARAILAQPRPLGLGLTVSIGALHAFYYRWRSDDLDEHLDILREQTDHILTQTGDDDEKFTLAAKHLLKRRFLEKTISPTSTTAELRALYAILDRMKVTDLAQRRLELAEREKRKAPHAD